MRSQITYPILLSSRIWYCFYMLWYTILGTIYPNSNKGVYSKEQVKFDFDKKCPSWIKNGPRHTTTICSHFSVYYSPYLFITAQQNRYALMCSVNAYDKWNGTSSNYVSIVFVRPLPYGSTTDGMKFLCNSFNCIDIWLLSSYRNYFWHCNIYKQKMSDLFK